jgi:integrase
MIETKDLLITFNEIQNKSEENIKILIVLEFLKKLGYNQNQFDFEKFIFHKDKRVDFIYEDEYKNPIYFETKRGDKDLTSKDIIQIADYLHIRNIEWGFLCNGKRLILINDQIRRVDQTESSLRDKIVFDINIYSKRDEKYIKFLTKEALLQSKITNYFRDITQFKALKFPQGKGSWNVYKSTLINFFNYYSEKMGKYRKLEEILIDDFEMYLRTDQIHKKSLKKSVNSEQTFNNKYSHLRSMFIELKKNGVIQSHHFNEDRKTLVKNLDTSRVIRTSNCFNIQNLNAIITFLSKSETSDRDILILYFCIFLGLERSTLVSLKWNMFNSELNKINLPNREIDLPLKITRYLEKIQQQNKKDGIKGDYLFYTKYRKKYNLLSESTINTIFYRLQKINGDESTWENFSPQFIRMNLPKILFNNGFTIEEISYLLAMDLQSLSKLISYNDIISKVGSSQKDLINKHPFKSLLN